MVLNNINSKSALFYERVSIIIIYHWENNKTTVSASHVWYGANLQCELGECKRGQRG